MLQQPTSPFLIKRRQECSLQTARRIAVVGLRTDPIYKSYNRTQKLIEYGLKVLPVIPNCKSAFGLACYDRDFLKELASRSAQNRPLPLNA